MNITKLMYLELKKNKIAKWLIIGLCTSILIFIFILLSSLYEYDGYQNYKSAIDFLNNTMLFNKIAWTIFFSVFLTQLFSEEFKSRTVYVLYTYPISRVKISIAKLLVIFGYITIFALLSMLWHSLVLIAIDYQLHPFLPQQVEKSLYMEFVLFTLINAVLMSVTSLITLFFDILFKSAKITIVSSIILISIIYGGVSDATFWGREVILLLVTSAIGIVAMLISFVKIKKASI